MKKLFTFCLAAAFGSLSAQPVLQYTNHIAPGNTGTVYVAPVPSSPGPSGAGVTWNFSALTFTPVGTVSVVQPTATPFSGSFPTANFAAVITGTAIGTMYVYNNVQPTISEQLGNNITATGGQSYTPNPKTELVFPMNYTNSFTDSYQCVSCSPSSVTRTYDGYGTLIINGNTYYNVVRVASNFGNYYYNYYNTNPLYSIFSFDTAPGTTTSGYIGLAGATGIKEDLLLANMQVYPNPAKDRLSITNANFQEVEVEIMDLMGKCVRQKEKIAQGNTVNADLSNFTAGLYFIKYLDEFGNASVSKLVVE